MIRAGALCSVNTSACVNTSAFNDEETTGWQVKEAIRAKQMQALESTLQHLLEQVKHRKKTVEVWKAKP